MAEPPEEQRSEETAETETEIQRVLLEAEAVARWAKKPFYIA